MGRWGWKPECQSESTASSILWGRYWQALNAEFSEQVENGAMRILMKFHLWVCLGSSEILVI